MFVAHKSENLLTCMKAQYIHYGAIRKLTAHTITAAYIIACVYV